MSRVKVTIRSLHRRTGYLTDALLGFPQTRWRVIIPAGYIGAGTYDFATWTVAMRFVDLMGLS
jgi:hypothetical protein